jgi:hypothetical protein
MQQKQYVWEDYSSTLYQMKKNPSAETIKQHMDELTNIMERSKELNLRVPPGVYCEYGFLLMKEGKKEEAFRYFDLEQQTYPESIVFITNLKGQIQ